MTYEQPQKHPLPRITRKIAKRYDIGDLKRHLFDGNDEALRYNREMGDLYRRQPLRTGCKLCARPLPSAVHFASHGLDYKLCEGCGHLNGLYQDGEDFAREVYLSSAYSNAYGNEDQYETRLEKIYRPKAEFLLDNLPTPTAGKQHAFLDIGAGSGYMVAALSRLGCNCLGLEISDEQVRFGNRMIGRPLLTTKEQAGITEEIAQTSRNVLSFIGVLEHIADLNRILVALKGNRNIEFLYFSVPCYSLSCVIEAAFPQVFNRHLGGGHTHLFTRKSLDWIYNEYSFQPLAIWDFGTDIMDLYRSLIVTLTAARASEAMIAEFSERFSAHLDSLQAVVDETGFCSETHVLAVSQQG